MPSFYRPDQKQEKREKAKYGASITFKWSEVDPKKVADFLKADDLFWATKTIAANIGYSLSQVTTGQLKDTFTAKCYSQYADMKDAGMSLGVTGCPSIPLAEAAVLMILKDCRYRLDTIPEDDVEF